MCRSFFILWISFLNVYTASAAQELSQVFSNKDSITTVTKGLMVLEDPTEKLSFADIMGSRDFKKYPDKVPIFPVGNYWIKFRIRNNTDVASLLLQVGQGHPRYEEVELYTVDENGKGTYQKTGSGQPFSSRKYQHQYCLLDISIPAHHTLDCYLRVKGKELVLLPIFVGTPIRIAESLNLNDIIFSIYLGIFLSMILYNLFIYFSIRDSTYLFYVFSAFCMLMSQLGLYGYLDRFIFTGSPDLGYEVYSVFNILVGAFITLFMRSFLKPDRYSPLLNKIIYALTASYGFMIILNIFGLYQLREILFDVLSVFGCILFYITVFIAMRKGYREAKFLLIGWTVFFIGNMLFVFRNEDILPYNIFTTFGLTAGTAIETVFLSFALADRINTLKKENEEKKNEIIRHLEMNERYLRTSRQLAIDAERLKKEVLATEFESLKNQVNPHFLFNSLNVLSELVYEAQEEAVRFVNELASIYRYVLDCKQKEVIELGAELRFINSYIFLLKIRFEENLKITINIPDAAHALIAPITLQLLIENAIKHNVVSGADPLYIDIFAEDSYLVIRNNIQLRRKHEISTGVGLKNIAARYRFLTDKEVMISQDKTYFTVRIPLVYFKGGEVIDQTTPATLKAGE